MSCSPLVIDGADIDRETAVFPTELQTLAPLVQRWCILPSTAGTTSITRPCETSCSERATAKGNTR
jgi:hypothetical protein